MMCGREDRVCRTHRGAPPSPGRPLRRSTASSGSPPRAHGDVIEGREVSFLELFYDLVSVVVVSQSARHLAGDVTWAGVGRFAVVFGLIWLAWINGAVYHDLHGRAEGTDPVLRLPPDGRPRPPRGVHRRVDRARRPGLRRHLQRVPLHARLALVLGAPPGRPGVPSRDDAVHRRRPGLGHGRRG